MSPHPQAAFAQAVTATREELRKEPIQTAQETAEAIVRRLITLGWREPLERPRVASPLGPKEPPSPEWLAQRAALRRAREHQAAQLNDDRVTTDGSGE